MRQFREKEPEQKYVCVDSMPVCRNLVWEDKEMRIKEKRNRDIITLEISGNLDTNSSAELQEARLNGFRNANHVVLDLEECNYVSSAGLRVLLMGQKTSIA